MIDGFHAAAAAAVLQIVWGVGAVVAGGAMLMCWKIGGRAAPGWIGVAFLTQGTLSVAYQSLSLARLGRVGVVEPYGRVVICVLVASCLVAALRSPEVDSGFRPINAATAALIIGVIGLDLLQATLAGRYLDPSWRSIMQYGTAGACWAVWVAVCVLSTWLYRKRRTSTGLWITTCTVVYASSAGFATLLSSTPWGLLIGQSGFLLASALAVAAASWEVRDTVRCQDRYALHLTAGREAMRAELERERADLAERLHDLRNAVAAVRSADTTLRRDSENLDERTRQSLAQAISAELGRLQTLIEPGRELRIEDFCLPDALEPVLATERTLGANIEAEIGLVMARGDRDAVAQVVQNLLTNARQYAPGGKVIVQAFSGRDRIELIVKDEGPGIPHHERTSVFGRGVRGSSSAGTSGLGIGLQVASTLMAKIGGSLRLADCPEGACFVVELPAASRATLRLTEEEQLSFPAEHSQLSASLLSA